MKRVFFAVAFICLIYAPAFAIERSVWTYTASDEICFELADVPNEALSIPMEDFTAPVDIETAMNPIEDEPNETEDEHPEELIEDEVASSMDGGLISQSTYPVEEISFEDNPVLV